MPIIDALAAIGDCGLQGVEVDLAMLTAAPAELWQLDRYALCATTLDVSALDPAAESFLKVLAPAMSAARELAIGIVIVSAGDDLGDTGRRERILKSLRDAAASAAARGLTLALETAPGLCHDTRGMQKTVEDLQQSNVGLNFDTGRFVQQNPWSTGEVALQRVFGQLASMRLTNFAVGAEPPEFPPLGQGGDVDCSRTWQILGGLKFAGPCTIAFRPPTRREPTSDQCHQWLRQCVDHLRGCGWFD